MPLNPQPTDMMTLTRNYATSKVDATYTKRVMWIASPFASQTFSVVEYKGTQPKAVTHGNARRTTSAYVRTSCICF